MDLVALILTIAAIVFIGVAFLVGYLMNPYAMVKIRRQFLKQDFGIAKLLSKDGRAFITKIITLEESSFELDDKIWFSKKGYVYRENHEQDGFYLKKVAKHTEEGLPTVYLDSTTLKPISLHVPDTKQTPGEMAAWMRTNSQIQLAKGLVKDKQQKQMQIATVALIGVVILGLVIIYGMVGDIQTTSAAAADNTAQIKTILEAVHGVSVQNGSIVYGAINGG